MNGSDVLIVGAGPVGLMSALELARRGVNFRIIDKTHAPTTQSRALAIFPRTLEIFDTLGLIEEFLAAGLEIRGVNVYSEGRRLAHLDFARVASPYPFVLSLPQSETERILIEHLRQFGVTVNRETRLTNFTRSEKGVVAELINAKGRIERCRSSWLIGCDGAHSMVREVLDVPFEGAPYAETFILADVKIEDWSERADEFHLFFHESGILAIFPLPAGRFRLIANIASDEKNLSPTLAEIQTIVSKGCSFAATLSDPAWLSAFHIAHRKVERFRAGRVFLAGDAAHIHSPSGGQGMNTGLQDAHNLAWKLALVIGKRSPEALLDSYDSERAPVAREVLKLTGLLTQLATLRKPLAQSLGNLTLPFFSQIAPLKERIASRLAELEIVYPRSRFVAEDWHERNFDLRKTGVRLGSRAPDIRLRKPTGESVRLFELLRDSRQLLLLFGGSESGDFEKLKEKWETGLKQSISNSSNPIASLPLKIGSQMRATRSLMIVLARIKSTARKIPVYILCAPMVISVFAPRQSKAKNFSTI